MAKYENLPIEMRQRTQWCVAKLEWDFETGKLIRESKAPLSVTKRGELYNASVIAPNQWLTFEQCVWLCNSDPELVIGYILAENDPFSCIDLDVKDCVNEPDCPEKWTTQDQFNLYYRILQNFNSYAESSQSGKGLHIWVKGKIGKGMHRDGVEVYSQERFIICTGNTVCNVPIADRSEMINEMVTQMRPLNGEGTSELVEITPEADDWYVLTQCVTATNSEKFCNLYEGRYQDYGFPSQSEADLALMSIFTFYSKSNEQCRRLFRDSILGQRDKAQDNDKYLNFTLKRIRARQSREENVNVSAIAKALTTRDMVQSELARLQGNPTEPRMLHVPGPEGTPDPVQLPPSSPAALAMVAPMGLPVKEAGDSGLPWPPGLTGQIAGFIYQNAPRPVKEIAVVSALGLLAGICGKAWCIPQSGLNIYLILVARSGVGKEALHSGASTLLNSVVSRDPFAAKFVNFSEFASGPALSKAVAENPCFVNFSGEIGRNLKRLGNETSRDTAMQSLRTVLTRLYSKSGPKDIVGGISYSDKDSNVASVSGVSYSLVGETTPTTFYESLTEGMMEDGFLSRFAIIEYNGDRPPLNPEPLLEPSKALADAIAELTRTASHHLGMSITIRVERSEDAAKLLKDFEIECDSEINSTIDESWRQMWSRAALKVMRISALLAVADNSKYPVIQKEHVEWALILIRKNIKIMQIRITQGDIGNSDSSRQSKVVSILREYLAIGAAESFGINPKMIKDGIIPRKVIQVKTASNSQFINHKSGSVFALDMVLKNLLDNGVIQEIDKPVAVANYGFHGKCYRILDL